MRRFIFLAGAVLLVIILLGITSGAAIATTGPFLPGSPLFPIQSFSEQAQARLHSPAERRVEAFFGLAERRIENLSAQTGTTHESESLACLDSALDQAVQLWAQLPPDSAVILQEQVIFLLKASEIAAGRLTVISVQNPDQLQAFLAKVVTLQALAQATEADPALFARLAEGEGFSSPEEISEQANLLNTAIDPLAVPFPPGSVASEHAFYPLVGQHAQITCEDCHANGIYEGTATDCEACHAGVEPVPHYTGDCAACHSPVSWSDISFDHTLVAASECVSCHQADKPANHFGNQCAACHSTATWEGASFNHQAVGATDCQSCHSSDKPANHFSGQCSACHSTNSWKGASFNHQAAGATDCQSCHSNDKPANHFSGQCSACHSTNTWDGASFSHAGQTDCKSCHVDDKPANHFSGQCSACHSTNDRDAEFSHTGQTDCKSCHSGDRPREHSNNQCSECHSTSDWDDADDDGGDDGGDDGDDGGDDGDDGGDDDGDNGGDDGGDDGDDDGEDGENSGLDAAPSKMAVGSHSPMACETCHQPGQTAFEPSHPSTANTLWQTIVTIFQNIVPFAFG